VFRHLSAIFMGSAIIGISLTTAGADPISPVLPDRDSDGNVRWGPGAGRSVADDAVAPGQKIYFEWTKDGKAHERYAPYKDSAGGQSKLYRFRLPPDRTITDWNQIIKRGDGESAVRAGNIQHNSPWAFHPLEDLDIPGRWKIPDFAPLEAPLTIYTAVDLNLYYSTNPLGPLNGTFKAGQTLDELGLEIIDGMIPGIQGMYFATTEFELDPDSATGWVPVGGPGALLNSASYQADNGPIALIAIHEGVPEPGTYMLVGSALLLVERCRRRLARGVNFSMSREMACASWFRRQSKIVG